MRRASRVVKIAISAAVLTASVALITGSALAVTSPVDVAGYSKSVSGASATVSTLVQVPALGTCPSLATFQAVNAGNILVSSNGRTGGGVVLICANGAPFYYPFTEINIVPPFSGRLWPNAVSPGDVVVVQTTESTSATTVSLRDVSKGWAVSDNGGGGAPSSVAAGMIAGNCTNGSPPCSPVPAFSGARFITSLNGRSLSGATRSSLVDASGAAQATPSAPLLGILFTATYRFSCTPANQALNNRC